jgi:hypothetical protein
MPVNIILWSSPVPGYLHRNAFGKGMQYAQFIVWNAVQYVPKELSAFTQPSESLSCVDTASPWCFFNTIPCRRGEHEKFPGGTGGPDVGPKEDIMELEKVLDEYRNGDESRRLSLFMAYRELREHFGRIEEESEHDDFTAIRFPWRRKHHVARAA